MKKGANNILWLAVLQATPLTQGEKYQSDFLHTLGLTLGYLLIVCVLVLLVLKLLYAQKKPEKSSQNPVSPLKLLDRFDLAPQQTLYLLKVGEKFLLIGNSEKGLNPLCELKKEELPENISEFSAEKNKFSGFPRLPNFWQTFKMLRWPGNKS